MGINPPGVPEVVDNEEKAVEEWLLDPQGQSESLRGKRQRRNPWEGAQTLFLSEDERVRSGIDTRLVENMTEEVLADGGLRPWGEGRHWKGV